MLRAIALLTSLSLCTPAWADEQPRRQISVQGQASILVPPDQAEIALSVEGRAASAGEAMAAVGRRSQAVIETLQAFAEPVQIRALQTRVDQVVKGTDRHWRRNSGEPVEMRATRQIEIQRLVIDRLPAVMDALSQHALAAIDRINPVVSNAAQIEDEILLEAVDDARQRAQGIARRLDMTLGLPISVNTYRQHRPAPQQARMLMAAEAGPAGGGYASTGENEINAQVDISFELEAP